MPTRLHRSRSAPPHHADTKPRTRFLRGCLVALGVMTLPFLCGCGEKRAPEPKVSYEKMTIGDATVEISIIKRHAERAILVPEQVNAYARPIADRLKQIGSTRAIVFAYPDAQPRSVHLDADPAGATIGVAFLDDTGKVDSGHRVGPREQVVLSDRSVRFALFCDAAWIGTKLDKGVKLVLPTDAAAEAEPEVTRITDPVPQVVKVDGHPLTVEVAWRSETRSRGLMYRNYIPEGTGMIFLFREERDQKFWMRNTRASLDIAYIGADYRIRNIITMKAHDLDPGDQYRSDGAVSIALETRAGWFRENGIKVGATLELPESVKACQQKAHP